MHSIIATGWWLLHEWSVMMSGLCRAAQGQWATALQILVMMISGMKYKANESCSRCCVPACSVKLILAHQRFFFSNGNIRKFCKVTENPSGWREFPAIIIFHITLQSFKHLIKLHQESLRPGYTLTIHSYQCFLQWIQTHLVYIFCAGIPLFYCKLLLAFVLSCPLWVKVHLSSPLTRQNEASISKVRSYVCEKCQLWRSLIFP